MCEYVTGTANGVERVTIACNVVHGQPLGATTDVDCENCNRIATASITYYWLEEVCGFSTDATLRWHTVSVTQYLCAEHVSEAAWEANASGDYEFSVRNLY